MKKLLLSTLIIFNVATHASHGKHSARTMINSHNYIYHAGSKNFNTSNFDKKTNEAQIMNRNNPCDKENCLNKAEKRIIPGSPEYTKMKSKQNSFLK